MNLFFIDCEAPYGVGAPSTGDMTEFGVVHFNTFDKAKKKDPKALQMGDY